MSEKIINNDNLMEIGFKKQYGHRADGFYVLTVDEKFYLTVDFVTMTLSIQLNGYGHVKRLDHIKTIAQIQGLFFDLTGKTIQPTEVGE